MATLSRTRRAVFAVALVASGLAAGCGGASLTAPPKALPADLVPATLPDPTDPANPYALVEFPGARERFAAAGGASLVDDGALWEIRRGANLVGTLEAATLKAKVDLSNPDNRKELISILVPSTSTTINVRGISVVRAVADDKTTYLILGNGLFELIDLRASDKVDPAVVLAALLDAQGPSGNLTLASDEPRRLPL